MSLLNWVLPSAFLLSLVINYYLYVFKYLYNYLTLTTKEFNLAFRYWAFYSLNIIMILLSFIQILSNKHSEFKKEYKLTDKKLKNLFVDQNSAYTHDILSSDTNDYTRITSKSNENLENYILKHNLNIITRNSLGQINVCLTCKIIKPDRCYHCKKCSKCILKRDHHCYWLNCCIGYANQKHFILFLVYLCLSKLITLVTTFKYFLVNVMQLFCCHDWNLAIVILFVINMILFVPLILLTINSIYLAAVNSTSIEIKYPPRYSKQINNESLNPFDLNSILLNLAQVFGSDLIFVFLPFQTTQGDGHIFPAKF